MSTVIWEGYEVVFDDEHLTILRRPGDRHDCIVSFAGVGRSHGGIDFQHPEFTKSGSNETMFFVIDKTRSWGNRVDWQIVYDAVTQHYSGLRLTTLGNSMGGFLAIYAAEMLGAQQAIAFAPQWSIDHAIVPEEGRWRNYREDIGTFNIPDLSGSLGGPAKIFAFFGGADPQDNVHLRHFAKYERITTYVVDEGTHEVALHLRDHGLLYPTIAAIRNQASVPALFEGTGVRISLA